jgi:ATP phosphoribosyltransferase regulatory subunit HisZ
MARLKSSSAVTEKAQTRLASLSSIDSALDLGSGLTLAAYRADIQDAQATLEAYNNLLSQADEAANQLHAAEADLRSLSERMLAGVAAKYGKDSNEYEMAGGVRKSEIKRPARKKQPA